MSPEPLHVVDGGRAPAGWEALWPRDVWFASELPHGDLAHRYRGGETLRFDRICQSWLKEAAKRWTRARLLSDTTPRTISAYLVSIRHFSQWLAAHAPEVTAPAGLSRAVLEDYMLWARHETDWKPATPQPTTTRRAAAAPRAGRGRPGRAAARRGDPRR
jgi:hypothetical protein